MERAKNSAITIKTSSTVKISSATRKDIKFQEKIIDKFEKEIASLNFKKEDILSKSEEMLKKLEASRKIRDETNKKIPELKEIKNNLESKKQELIIRKRSLGDQLSDETDKKKKKELYEEFIQVKKELNQVFEDLNPAWEEFKEALNISKEEHTNMQIYYRMSSQSRKEADKIHHEVKKLKKKLYNSYKKLRELQHPSR